jgi:EAL domain-containing protein (putative c-di-GMP-specific phosphodiesterase class I)
VALKQAIERQEFVLHYQPIFDLSTQQTLRFEALVRWQHPTRGLVMPGEFIEIAEENGAIVPLGTLILKLACRQIQQWREAGQIPLDVGVSVNTAGLQFVHSQLDQEVAIALAESGLPPENLHIEVTESAIAAHTETVFSTLERIRAQGVSIALDDFGTGHSSLARLQSLPIDCLKVDRAFIARMHKSDRDREFVRAILNFAHSLGMFTVAEGIETLKQRNELIAMGCPWGQGFWFSRPLADPTQLWTKVAPAAAAHSPASAVARSQPLRDRGILGT